MSSSLPVEGNKVRLMTRTKQRKSPLVCFKTTQLSRAQRECITCVSKYIFFMLSGPIISPVFHFVQCTNLTFKFSLAIFSSQSTRLSSTADLNCFLKGFLPSSYVAPFRVEFNFALESLKRVCDASCASINPILMLCIQNLVEYK